MRLFRHHFVHSDQFPWKATIFLSNNIHEIMMDVRRFEHVHIVNIVLNRSIHSRKAIIFGSNTFALLIFRC